MPQIKCPVSTCDRPRPGNRNICGACDQDLINALQKVPFLAEELDTTLSRQSVMNAGGGGKTLPYTSREKPLPFNAAASDAISVLRETLTAWMRALQPEQPATTIPGMSRWLLSRHRLLVAHHDADLAVEQIVTATKTAERIIDRPIGRWYAGACSCTADLYAKANSATVICHTCGKTYEAGERKAFLLTAAEDMLGGAAFLSQALSTLGTPIKDTRIRKWAERKRIVAHGTDPQGHPLYRVGDVLGLLAEQQRDKVAS